MHIDDVYATIERIFGQSEPETALVCTKITNYILDNEGEKLRLTLSLLHAIAGNPSIDALMGAIQYLTGAHARLLDMQFEFVDEVGDFHSLTKQEVADARVTKQLEHPGTGEMIKNYESSVLVYYVPSAQFNSRQPLVN